MTRLGLRIFLSVLVILAITLGVGLYSTAKVAWEAAGAVNQAKDSVAAYSFGQQMARGNLLPSSGMLVLVGLAVLVGIWLMPLIAAMRKKGSSTTAALCLVGVLAAGTFLSGCGPAHVQKFQTIEANETAFVIPLQGATSDQAKFQSVEYLKQRQVGLKRIEIPTVEHDLGRGPGDYEYIDTVKVVKVNRTP